MIELRNGIQISKPLERIEYYWGREGGARAYDKARLPQDNSFTEDQIKQVVNLINRLGAMMRSQEVKDKVIKGLLHKRQEIELRLAEISTELTLLDREEEIPWHKIELLFDTCRIEQVRLARMTKILHKKRPNLIPILDNGVVVSQYLEPILQERGIITRKENERAICYIKELKTDIEKNREALVKLQHTLNTKGFDTYDTSFGRLIDIIIWGYFSYKEKS